VLLDKRYLLGLTIYQDHCINLKRC